MAAEAEALPVAAAGTVEYVVQVREEFEERGGGDPYFMWRDFATITVAPRTKRGTVIRKALREAQGLRPTGPSDDALVVRVLGPEDARPFKVSAVQRDPELRIEGV
jgi:hypothetical protein